MLQGLVLPMVMAAGDTGPTFFVSPTGSDSADGLTAETAWQTVSKVNGETFGVGSTIAFERGGTWREQLDLRSQVSLAVSAYGAGAMPVFDAADVITAWTSSGTANVYQATVVTPPSGDGGRHSAWEDGVRMPRASSLAGCGTTPGSMFVDGTTVYIHPAGSTDPTSNGRTYEVSVRDYGVILDDNQIIDGIRTKRNYHNNGSLVTGANCIVRNCIAEDGTRHNLFILSGLAEDTVAWKTEDPHYIDTEVLFDTCTMFVSFAEEGEGRSTTFRRCTAFGSNYAGVAGFYQHTTGSPSFYDSVLFDSCYAYQCEGAFSTQEALVTTVRDCLADACGQFGTFAAGSTTIENSTMLNTAAFTSQGRLLGGQNITATNSRFHFRVASGAITFNTEGLTLENCTFWRGTNSGFTALVSASTEATAGVLVSRCVLYEVDQPYYYDTGLAPAAGTDFNVFWTDGAVEFWEDNTMYTSLAAWQAGTAFDTNSVNGTDDMFAGDPSANDWSFEEGTAPLLLGAGADNNGPALPDWSAIETALATS